MAKEHLDFDLEFLDSDKAEASKERPHYHKETFPSRRDQTATGSTKRSIGRLAWWWAAKTRRKKVEFIVGVIASLIILGTIVIAATTPDTSTVSSGSTPPPATIPVANTPADQTYKFTDENGKIYYCSVSDNAKATALEPTDFEKSSIESEKTSVALKESELNRLQSEIDSMYVNEYSSQFLINRYNDLIDEYNLKHSTYERQFDNLDTKIDSYNQKVETYNNFLRNNCSPS